MVFAVRVSMAFHLVFVYIMFSSVRLLRVATFWERAVHSVDLFVF